MNDQNTVKEAFKKLITAFSYIYSILICVLLWELLARTRFVPYYFLPPISDIARFSYFALLDGTLLQHTGITLYRALTGYTFSILIGIPIGIFMSMSRAFNWFFDPIVAILLPVPPLTLVPIFILWFGIGHEAKIMLVIISCVSIVIASTYNGAKSVNPFFIWSARIMGTPKRKILWKIIMPASLPYIFNGMQVALPISIIAAFVFEMISGGSGLGFLESYAARFFEAPQLFSALFATAIIGLALDRLLSKLRSLFLKWY
ncbi:MAG: ABC transporter permease [Candidatus Bathyarchaeia archaeon]